MSVLCRILGHQWDGCRCRRCGLVRNEAHQWNGCTCRRCGQVRNTEHRWNGCVCEICGRKRDAEHDWNGCKCRRCGKTREEGHQADTQLLMKNAKWVHHGAVIQSWKDTTVQCRVCGKTLAHLKKGKTYCPKCYCEIERQYVPSDEPTLLKYRFACPSCGYEKTISVSDGY